MPQKLQSTLQSTFSVTALKSKVCGHLDWTRSYFFLSLFSKTSSGGGKHVPLNSWDHASLHLLSLHDISVFHSTFPAHRAVCAHTPAFCSHLKEWPPAALEAGILGHHRVLPGGFPPHIPTAQRRWGEERVDKQKQASKHPMGASGRFPKTWALCLLRTSDDSSFLAGL